MEETIGEFALSARNRMLHRMPPGTQYRESQTRVGRPWRRPDTGNQQRVEHRVRVVGGLWRGEIAKVAIEVDIVLVAARVVRESPGIERVQHDDAHPAAVGCAASVVGKQRGLDRGAGKAFDAMRARRDDQHGLGGRVAATRNVDREFATVSIAQVRMNLR